MNLALSILPERASTMRSSVDAIFYSLLLVCGLVTVGVVAAIIFCCLRYRMGSNAPRGEVAGPKTRNWIEATWTSATLLAFIAIFIWAGVVYFRMYAPPANATEIHVVAKQWMWKAQHVNGRREINELHLLVGQPVKLIMTSQDVIHDFFVPAFRTKQDVLPGRYTAEWFIPTKPGVYHLFCAEYCGMDHSRMGGWIYVHGGASLRALARRFRRKRSRSWRPGGGCSSRAAAAAATRPMRRCTRRCWRAFIANRSRSRTAAWSSRTSNTCTTPSCCRTNKSPPATSQRCPLTKASSRRRRCMALIAYLKSLDQRRAMNAIATPQARPQPASAEPSYLHEHTLRSWLLTTDHKRIGLLYMITSRSSSSSAARRPR